MIYYYELDTDYRRDGYPAYIYETHFDYFLSAISSRVFELKDKRLHCISGDTTYYYLDSKETTFILLSARPRTSKLFNYFDPGHA